MAESFTYKIVHWLKHSTTTMSKIFMILYCKVLNVFYFKISLLFNPSMFYSKLELLMHG